MTASEIIEALRGFADTEMPVEALAVLLAAADMIERLQAALAATELAELYDPIETSR